MIRLNQPLPAGWLAAVLLACGAAASVRGEAPASRPATQPALGLDVGNAQILEQTKNLELYPLGRHPTGKLRVVGSTTVTHIVHSWAEEYARLQPNVSVHIDGSGSSNGIPGLIAGSADIAALSRGATAEEIAAFAKAFGYPPTEIEVGIDAIAIFVHRTNPLPAISLAQLDAMYSRVPQHPGMTTVDTWGVLGLGGEWKDLAPVRYSELSGHGTYDEFHKLVLLGGRFRLDIREEEFLSSLVQGVAADRGAIGYASAMYATPAVRALPLSSNNEGPSYLPTRDNVIRGTYPLSRRLLLYVNKAPARPLPTAVADFAAFTISQIGQQVAGNSGMMPISRESQQKSMDYLR